MEERFRAGELSGFLHVAIGQEAVAVGVCQAMADGDVFASTHRAHAHALARGMHPNALMAELYGKIEGCSHGYGGSMHLYDVEHRLPRRQRGRRRRAAGDHRRRARVQAAQGAARRRGVLRRRGDEHRHLPRVAEPRAALAGARRVRLREQPLRGVDAGLAAAADQGPGQARGRVRHALDHRRRAGRRGGAPRGRSRARARALRKGPRVPALRDLPARRPLRRRPAGLPGQGGGQGAAREPGSARPRAGEARALRGGGRRPSSARSRSWSRARSSSPRPGPTRGPRTRSTTSTPSARAELQRGRSRCALARHARGRGRVHHGRGHRRDGRFDGASRRGCWPSSGPSACGTRRSRRWRSSAPASARPFRACGRSSRSCTRTSRRWPWSRSSTRPRSTATCRAASSRCR